MRNMKFNLMMLVMALVAGFVLAGCAPTGETFNYSRPEYADSPHGSVSQGTEIMSADQHYLARFEGSGISVFAPQPDGQGKVKICSWSIGSDIKAMAWGPDCKRVAVMNHRGDLGRRSEITVHKVSWSLPVASGSAAGYYHRMRWNDEGTGVYLSDGDSSSDTFVSFNNVSATISTAGIVISMIIAILEAISTVIPA